MDVGASSRTPSRPWGLHHIDYKSKVPKIAEDTSAGREIEFEPVVMDVGASSQTPSLPWGLDHIDGTEGDEIPDDPWATLVSV